MQGPLDDIELVVNFADHFFENIFERHEAENRAEFIDHHGETGALGAKLEKQLDGELRFRHDDDFAKDMLQREFRGGGAFLRTSRPVEQHPNDILDVNESIDVVESAFID